MLDAVALDRSIKIRALGRLLVSRHPFNILIKGMLDTRHYFFPNFVSGICSFTGTATKMLGEERQKTLNNHGLMTNVKLLCLIKETPIKNIISAAGLNSIVYFQCRRAGLNMVGQLDVNKLALLERHISLKIFIPWIRASSQIRAAPLNEGDRLTLRGRDRPYPLESLTAKQIRELNSTEIPVTMFKIGLHLSIADSLTWCHRIKKLTSARH